jgi:hypothetical protein
VLIVLLTCAGVPPREQMHLGHAQILIKSTSSSVAGAQSNYELPKQFTWFCVFDHVQVFHQVE